VTPTNISIKIGSNQTFTAKGYDQYGNLIAIGPITWSSTAGNVSGSGVFKALSTGTQIRITATVGSISASALVTAFQADLDGAHAWPVPFKPASGHTTITFTGLGADTTIKIYTVTGELIKHLHNDGDVPSLAWDVKNADGHPVASGVYVYQLKNPYSEKRGKLVIVR